MFSNFLYFTRNHRGQMAIKCRKPKETPVDLTNGIRRPLHRQNESSGKGSRWVSKLPSYDSQLNELSCVVRTRL